MVAPGPAEAGFPTLSANTGGQGQGTLRRNRRSFGSVRFALSVQDITKRFGRIAVLVRHTGRRGVDVLGTQSVEQGLLLAGQEAQLQPAEDVIHDRLGVADVLVLSLIHISEPT